MTLFTLNANLYDVNTIPLFMISVISVYLVCINIAMLFVFLF